MTRLIPLLLTLLFTAGSFAGDVTITGDSTIPANKAPLVKLAANGVDAKAGLIWRISPKAGTERAELTTRGRLQFAALPGTYVVELLAVKLGADGTTEIDEASVTVTVGGTPNPPPGPGPVTEQRLHIIVIEETDDAVAGRGAYFANQELRDRIKAKSHGWRLADKDARDKDGNVPTDLAPYIERAKGKPFPTLFLVTKDGTMVYEGALPATPAALVELLKSKGG